MLAFKYRFHGHGSLRYVYSHGKAVRSRLVTLKYSRHPKRKTPRLAVVVSKKVYKGAVGRNRIRRRIYEILRQEVPKFHYNQDLVFIIFTSEVLTMPHEELKEAILQLLASADVYSDSDQQSSGGEK
jgi:ribonuclease P protein component